VKTVKRRSRQGGRRKGEDGVNEAEELEDLFVSKDDTVGVPEQEADVPPIPARLLPPAGTATTFNVVVKRPTHSESRNGPFIPYIASGNNKGRTKI